MHFSSLSLFACSLVLFWTTTLLMTVQTFVLVPSTRVRSIPTTTSTLLSATKKKKSSNKKKSSTGGVGGFGGASMEPCPCGSSAETTYSNCCSKLHRDVNAYKSATAEQVVRARYSAFAKKQPEFLMASTHPLNKEFDTDLKKWKESIKKNMYDNFELPRCVIVEESYPSEDKAEVKFIAQMILRESGEKTSFMETSTFERAKTHGGWLYLNGTIEFVPDELSEGSDDDSTGKGDESLDELSDEAP